MIHDAFELVSPAAPSPVSKLSTLLDPPAAPSSTSDATLFLRLGARVPIGLYWDAPEFLLLLLRRRSPAANAEEESQASGEN